MARDDITDFRPIAYVEPGPIIRRIGERELFIGNIHAADDSVHDYIFDHVVSATTEACPLTTHHHPLTDGPGNDWETFEHAVDTTRECYNSEGSVLVHCKAGISRSTTLLATTLAIEEGLEFGEALEMVQDARPMATPHPALHELAIQYLAAMREVDR